MVKSTNAQANDGLVVPNRSHGSLTSSLFDLGVLDCPICTESLSAPVFQCKNGHMLCSTCCIKLKNNCPSCFTEIKNIRCRPVEKVLESLKIPCQNRANYGCNEVFFYSEKCIHVKMCDYPPCSCPAYDCDFAGNSAELAKHFRSHFCKSDLVYNAPNSFFMYFSWRYKFFQEKKEGTIFIVSNKSLSNGNSFKVSCIGSLSKKRFYYDLVSTHSSKEGTCLRLQSTTDIIQGLPTDEPEDIIKSLIVPSNWSIYLDKKPLQLWIWEDRKPAILTGLQKRRWESYDIWGRVFVIVLVMLIIRGKLMASWNGSLLLRRNFLISW